MILTFSLWVSIFKKILFSLRLTSVQLYRYTWLDLAHSLQHDMHAHYLNYTGGDPDVREQDRGYC